MTNPALRALSEVGVAAWLDDLGRERIDSGELGALVGHGVVGVTTNPSIFAAAISTGEIYAERIRAHRGRSASESLEAVMVADVQDACDVLRPVFEATNGVDGRVSLEVDPLLAHDTDATAAAAARIWDAVDRPNLMVKIPATEAGLPAITAAVAAGISVNVTLIFSVDRYRAVQEAWLTGLASRATAGHPVQTLGSVASFFISRLDSAVDARLDALLHNGEISSTHHASLRGRAAVANARQAYRDFAAMLGTPRWKSLHAAGAQPQRTLWASTSAKDPAYSATRYVDELVAPSTVNTMPKATLDAVMSGAGSASDTIDLSSAAASADAGLFDELAALGITYDDVVGALEAQGVAAFSDAWTGLLTQVEQVLDAG